MRQNPSSTGRLEACETQRKLELPCLPHRSHRRHRPRKGGYYVLALTLLVAPLGAVGYTDAEPRSVHQVEGSPAHAPAAAGEEEHAGRGVVDVLARIVNFGILAGTLFYFLRSPLRTYLGDRTTTIRSDLVNAAEMKKTAAAQIEEIDRRMKALPGELDALRAQGAQEIAAEEGRIQAAAAAERERLVAQAKREIDLKVKIAERELVAHAANLAVGVASERIKKNITDDDQKRLVDRYVQQLRPS